MPTPYEDMTPVPSFRWTFWLILSTVIVWLAYDVWAYYRAGDGGTISEVTLWASWRFPVIPFTVGVICGHLFWPQWIAR